MVGCVTNRAHVLCGCVAVRRAAVPIRQPHFYPSIPECRAEAEERSPRFSKIFRGLSRCREHQKKALKLSSWTSKKSCWVLEDMNMRSVLRHRFLSARHARHKYTMLRFQTVTSKLHIKFRCVLVGCLRISVL